MGIHVTNVTKDSAFYARKNEDEDCLLLLMVAIFTINTSNYFY